MEERRKSRLPVIVAAIVIVGVVIMWIFTIRERNEIISRGQNDEQEEEVVYSEDVDE